MEVLKHDNAEISFVAGTPEERETIEVVLKDYIKGRGIINKSYNQFNGRSLFDAIDDWEKRWNGYIPEASPLLDKYQSRIFLNFTRNQIISYLSKVALNVAEPKIVAVNKKSGVQSKLFAQILKDLNQFSLNEENGDAKFLESALEATVKGTVVVYEGYIRQEQKVEVPIEFDATTGKIKTKKETRVLYDNCYQQVVPLEDLYVANPYQPDIQKQPFVIWKRITTRQEAEMEYGKYENFKLIPKTAYLIASEPTTFYRNTLQTELGADQVEIIKYYNRPKNWHVVIINGVLMYDGVFAFKDGKYPFAKGIFEPFGANSFFWGSSFVNKIQGDQDLLNTIWNMMVDKTYGSLLPYGLSSDMDDLIEDEYLQPNKIRKVGDINKWKFDSLPGVTAGEMSMLEMAQKFAQDNSGNVIGGGTQQPKGKVTARQALLQQQESMMKMGFSMSFLEDFERDRTDLRVKHILQFYSIPKIEKITGRNGKEIEKVTYREARLSGVKLSDGKEGERVVKFIGTTPNDQERVKMEEDFSQQEVAGELKGVPTEVLALAVDTISDYNYDIQIIKNSSYQKTSVLDQAQRQDFANWRLALAQLAPLDAAKLVRWVEESYDIDSEEFELPPGQPAQQNPALQQEAGQQAPGSAQQPNNQMKANKMGSLSAAL